MKIVRGELKTFISCFSGFNFDGRRNFCRQTIKRCGRAQIFVLFRVLAKNTIERKADKIKAWVAKINDDRLEKSRR